MCPITVCKKSQLYRKRLGLLCFRCLRAILACEINTFKWFYIMMQQIKLCLHQDHGNKSPSALDDDDVFLPSVCADR